ncbi:MAG: hypothetical protein R6U61_02225 [Thermoplasmata archaeon]
MKILERKVSQLTVCDYCRYRKCGWSEHDARDPPDICLKKTPLVIADVFVGKGKFNRRVKVAKRLASYNPSEKTWYLDPTVKNPLTGYELREVIHEVNGWTVKNDFQLSKLVEYKEEGFEKFG